MSAPHIRIFPHSREEFPSIDVLTNWLMTGLRARAGVYHMRSANAVKDLPRGSIVLFRYGDKIVAEAVVANYVKEPTPDRTMAGQEIQYEARAEFVTSSIRVYSPPVSIEALQEIVGKEPNMIPSAQPYFKIEDWSIYPRLLAEVGARGSFL